MLYIPSLKFKEVSLSTSFYVTSYIHHRNLTQESSVSLVREKTEKEINSKFQLSKGGHVCNGLVSTIFTVAVTQPLYTYKTFVMNGLRMPGFSKLYKGYSVNAFCGGLAEGAIFGMEETASRAFKEKDKESLKADFLVSFSSGAMGGPLNAIWERIMTLQQLKGLSVRNTLVFLKKEEGICRGLLKGSSAAAWRDGFFNIGVFSLNRTLQKRISPLTGKDQAAFISGTVSGMLVGYLSAPFDLIKTLVQSEVSKKRMRIHKVSQEIIKKEGVKGLFKGASIRAGLIGVFIGVMSYTKEKIPQVLPRSLYEEE